MKKIFSIIVLVFSGFVFQNCKSAGSTGLDAQIISPTPTSQTSNISEKKVEFKGVSFTYNPQIFGEVKAKEIAEQPLNLETDKPDSVAPQHTLFSLITSDKRVSTIAVYPIEEYRRVWKPVEKNNATYFNENLINLKKLIADKNFRRNGEVPYLPYIDGRQTFHAKVKTAAFRSGKGVFFLTQMVQESALVDNGHLGYYFQGISDNDRYFILGQFSPKVSFLPDDYNGGKFEDYTMPDTINWSKSERKKYKEYIAKITKRLEELPVEEFEPNLTYFENIINSLKIEK